MGDQLGTPRTIADQTGSLARIKRHDYLPFGEEIGLIGGRTGGQGYMADGARQKFTGYERDAETGLDYANARYDASAQGRFLSVDPLQASAELTDPQSLNRYSYCLNNPTNLTDPDGMMAVNASQGWGDVAGGFWGESLNFGAPPAQQNHIAGAMLRDDVIRETGYDPGLGHYRGDVEVEYVTDGYSRSRTLERPTLAQVDATMEDISNSNSAFAQKGRNIPRGGKERASNPKNDPRNWQPMDTGRGRRQWRYVGPRPWREGLETVGGAWSVGRDARRLPKPYGWHEHHIFPREFRPTFRRAGINIDRATVYLPSRVHRGLHGPWNGLWRNFLLKNPQASQAQMYNFAFQLMRDYSLNMYLGR